ncbi:hypothetical protein CSV80_04865 [Sporosarcina sp. P12(2017)]|nr:hypothetical protein CSV81_05785 [Sporosarcina sp. P10]PIC61738.1 hypothetical protein CSV80_04865 [Sporosarcina sp. P12(2017)]
MVVVLSGKAKQEMAYSTRPRDAFGGATMRLRVFGIFGWDRCSTGCWGMKLVCVCFLDPHRHVGDCLQPGASWQSAASCLMATASPAVVPALLSESYLNCGSKWPNKMIISVHYPT